MTRRFAAVAVLLFVLGLPRSSDAGILEFIWEMSGPQLIGYGHSCILPLRTKPVRCQFDVVRESTDDQNRRMTSILKLSKLLEYDTVADVNVRRGRIEP